MEVSLICSVEEYKKLKKILKEPNSVRVIHDDNSGTRSVIEKRIDQIKHALIFPMRKETLYRKLKKSGYVRSRKTFLRDLTILEKENFLKKEINYADGCYTMLLKGDDNEF